MKTTWLTDSEIYAGQLLLKREFPFVDGLIDPVVKGPLVVLATLEFVQIVNNASLWVCLSTISTQFNFGTFKIFDSMYCTPHPNAI